MAVPLSGGGNARATSAARASDPSTATRPPDWYPTSDVGVAECEASRATAAARALPSFVGASSSMVEPVPGPAPGDGEAFGALAIVRTLERRLLPGRRVGGCAWSPVSILVLARRAGG